MGRPSLALSPAELETVRRGAGRPEQKSLIELAVALDMDRGTVDRRAKRAGYVLVPLTGYLMFTLAEYAEYEAMLMRAASEPLPLGRQRRRKRANTQSASSRKKLRKGASIQSASVSSALGTALPAAVGV